MWFFFCYEHKWVVEAARPCSAAALGSGSGFTDCPSSASSQAFAIITTLKLRAECI